MRTKRRRALPTLEGLEGRALMSTVPAGSDMTALGVAHFASFWSFGADPAAAPATSDGQASPLWIRSPRTLFNPGSPPGGMTPTMIKTAYDYPTSLNKPGLGETIAIIDAYDDPYIAQELYWFDSTFSLPQMNAGAGSPTLTRALPQGQTPLDPFGGEWDVETALDVEWAHAIAPYANILLVEAKSQSYQDLLAADQYATVHGAVVASNSWGYAEFAGETSNDPALSTSAPITYVAASGDHGSVLYPSTSGSMVAVGGTSLFLNPDDTIMNETAWSYLGGSGGGGGTSTIEAKPSFQSALPYSRRSTPDVAYDSDPATGFPVYSFAAGGWLVVGGTSDASPQWAALIAIADQQRATVSKAPLTTAQTLNAIYSMTSNTTGTGQLHDITSGQGLNGPAGPGYDLVTGNGSPDDTAVINFLKAY